MLRPLRALQGLLLYLPNTFVMPNAGLAVLAVLSILIYRPTIRREDWPYFLFALSVVLNALLGVVVEGQFPTSIFQNNGFEGGVILVLAYLTARSLNDTVWKALLFFIVLEGLAIYLQFALGYRFFFPQQQDISLLTEFEYTQAVGGETLWYYIRPQGLSMSSTIAGSKMLLGILLAYMLPMEKRIRWLLIAFLLGAVVMNFKRSGILSLGGFFGVLFVVDVLNNGWHKRHTWAAAAGLLVATYALGTIIAQLTREQALSLEGISSSVVVTQLAGRAEIWGEALRFIRENFWFGNFSARYTIGTGQYAHNSYFSLIATHGIFLAMLLATYYFHQILKQPIVLVILGALLIDAFFQEHLFWYISQLDLFLLYLLTTRRPSSYWLTPWPQVPRRAAA